MKNKFEKPNSSPCANHVCTKKNWPLQHKCPLDIQTAAQKVLLDPPKTYQANTKPEDVFWMSIRVYPTTYIHLPNGKKSKKKKTKHIGLQSPQKTAWPMARVPSSMIHLGCVSGTCPKSRITWNQLGSWASSQGAGGKQKNEKKCSEKKNFLGIFGINFMK